MASSTHPLSPDEPTLRRPRAAASQQRPLTNYFDLKRDSDARASHAFDDGNSDELATPRWTGPVHSTNTPLTLRHRPSAALILDPIKDGDETLALDSPASTSAHASASAPVSVSPAQVLKTPWHELDNPSVNAVLTTSNALRDALRVISRALDDTNSRYAELQAIRQRESGAQDRARQRVKKIMWDLDEQQRAVARTIMDAVFAEDPEEVLAVPLNTINNEDIDTVSAYLPRLTTL